MDTARKHNTLILVGTIAVAMGYLGLLAGTIAFGVINRDMIVNMPLLICLAALVFVLGPVAYLLLRRRRIVGAAGVAT